LLSHTVKITFLHYHASIDSTFLPPNEASPPHAICASLIRFRAIPTDRMRNEPLARIQLCVIDELSSHWLFRKWRGVIALMPRERRRSFLELQHAFPNSFGRSGCMILIPVGSKPTLEFYAHIMAAFALSIPFETFRCRQVLTNVETFSRNHLSSEKEKWVSEFKSCLQHCPANCWECYEKHESKL
jgi:hypothetical protein